KLAFKIIHSTTKLLPAWKAVLSTLKLREKLLPRDVKMRWNSMYDMLDVAVRYQQAVDMLTNNKSNGLRSFELLPEEWEIASQLHKVFKDATTFFSWSSAPNLATVIPAIDHIDSHLTMVSLDAKYKNPIHVACSLAQKTLNKYYSLTNGSIAYHIVMGL
ncbi:uncharacterized protein TRAVEDRAFT_131865, partial [Trametes versicolor FP-101664 SS1]|uniref:uncharacterized protein n=1 Tax=Trametes versicolor (strain FP-101664) TaxID=717944 RepID=UPI00046225CF